MKVSLIGMGCGPDTLTAEASAAVSAADLCVGAERLLKWLPDSDVEQIAEYRPTVIADLLKQKAPERPCILLSGDSGFYSGAAGLLPILQEMDAETEVLPGISSLQYLAAKLGRPWQDWRLCSAHGVDCDPVFEVMHGQPTLFLTSGENGPWELCSRLTEAGLGELGVTVGENLGEPTEQISVGKAEMFAARRFAPLNVLLAEAAPVFPRRAPGIPDGEFLRDKVPMTKQEVRAVILSKLAVTPKDVCWDIGAGTGSVSVELSLHAREVWAVEQKGEAAELARKNREKFQAWNLHITEGQAPDVLTAFPKPDAVFVGGSGGHLAEILDAVNHANPKARVCVSAISLETLHGASESLERLGYTVEITQVSVSRTRTAGSLHLLTAQNPVFLITGVRQ